MLSVHVGLHKTGSTSIQAALETSKGHIGRRQAYLRWTDLFVTDGVIDVTAARRVRDLGARGWHAVVSSEGALGPMSMDTVYPDAARVAGRLDELFGDNGLRVIVYLRPQHDWAASAYAQYVRGGGTRHPQDFVATMLEQPYLHHTALVDDLRSSLRPGQLVVRPYRSGMDVVSDFFDVAGLGPLPAYLGEQRANVSLSAEQTCALRQANVFGGLDAERWAAAAPVAQSGERSPLPEDCQTELHAFFAADWTRLGAMVATMPGHDPAEFLDEVRTGARWRPQPFAEPVPPLRRATQTARGATAVPSGWRRGRASSAVRERLSRCRFYARHGLRRMLLTALTTWQHPRAGRRRGLRVR